MSNKIDYEKHMLAVSYVEAIMREDKETQTLILEELGGISMNEHLTDLLIISITTYMVSQGTVPSSSEEHMEAVMDNLRHMRMGFVERT